jgi:hypothetical protein
MTTRYPADPNQTRVLPPDHPWLRYLRTPGSGWYVERKRGCLVDFDGPFPTEQAARDTLPSEK